MEHICILICYKNIDHIKECFESLYTENIDFFIIENFSDNSEEIYNFFKTKKIKGYIRFEKNITNNAVTIFIRDNIELLKQYKFITFSDCDLIIKNSEETFAEIKKNLYFEDVVISCVDLDMNNLPKVVNSESWVPPPINVTSDYIEGWCGVHLMTLKQNDLWIVEKIPFLDSNIKNKVIMYEKKWVKTLNSKAYHLTWDLYYEGNDYYEFKITKNIWNHNEFCDYKLIKS